MVKGTIFYPNVKKDIPGEFISMYMPNPLKSHFTRRIG